MLYICVFTVVSLLTFLSPATSAARRDFTAATYDHARFGGLDDPPQLVVETNLRKYIKAAEIASSKGADIILYPETGLYFPGDRTQLKNYLEDVPDPKTTQTNPCEEKEAYLLRPILLTLSCIAKNNSIVVVANTGDIKNCSGQPDCPEDGVFHYNTNVAFDKDGTLLVRYYKEHLFIELGMDLPREQQDPTFKTDFGTFATYICFDIIFERMSQVAKWPQVDAIMFSSMWFDSAPQYVSVPLWQSWAMGNNATIVASNIQIPGYSALGSGIFQGRHGFLGYTYSPDGISKLVVAKISAADPPVPSKSSVTAFNDTNSWDWKTDEEDVSEVCSRTLLNDTDNLMTDHRCFEENMANYTLVKLTNSSGYAEACNNGMCCSVSYSTESMLEDFYLGVYNGTYNLANRYYWCEESCFIARCDAVGNQPCSTFPRRASTRFHRFELRSNFTTEYIYPSVVSSKVRLVPLTEWAFDVAQKSAYESSIHFHSEAGRTLINAGFKARCYQRDPPYVR